MLAYHFTESLEAFNLFGNHVVMDALDTLAANGFVDRLVSGTEVDSPWHPHVRGVTFALLEQGVHRGLMSYARMMRREGMVVLDLEDCHDDDFIQGQWLPDELVIVNPARVRIAAKVHLPRCTFATEYVADGQCDYYAQFEGTRCGWHTDDDGSPLLRVL